MTKTNMPCLGSLFNDFAIISQSAYSAAADRVSENWQLQEMWNNKYWRTRRRTVDWRTAQRGVWQAAPRNVKPRRAVEAFTTASCRYGVDGTPTAVALYTATGGALTKYVERLDWDL